ncbi:MAG: hypothetical protein AAGG51_20955 [Cyanobacteria bacterium P01_G01_bin.54]
MMKNDHDTVNHSPDVLTQLQQVIETAKTQADKRNTEIIAFQAIQLVDRTPELRQQAIAAYRAGELAAWQQDTESIEAFVVGAIAEWSAE